MDNSDPNESDEEIVADAILLQAHANKFLTKVVRRSQKRKPEKPSVEDTQQKKPKESQEEIKLELTKDAFSRDLRGTIEALETRNVNRLTLIAQLWKLFKACEKIGCPLEFYSFHALEAGWVACVLLDRLREATEEKEIAAVLAICALVVEFDEYGDVARQLVNKGLDDQLPVIIKSHLDQTDIVERGLIVAGCLASPRAEVTNTLTILGFVSTLEKIMESYSNNHDVMWRACEVCWVLTTEYDEENQAIDAIKKSKIPKLLEQTRAAFPRECKAHSEAVKALEHINYF